MQTKLILALIIVLVFGGSFLAKGLLVTPPGETVFDPRRSRRIVSMAPSVTETLFALGQGDRVVGVTKFCDFPPEAREKASVGGHLNPNYEAIVSLRPDLVITPVPEGHTGAAFDRLGLNTLTVCHKNVEGILQSITDIGQACGAQQEAERIVSDIQARLERVEKKTAGLDRPQVMFVIERTLGTGNLQDVYIAGRGGHIDRSIELAGGQNVYHHGSVRYPVVSTEGILQMNPQVIVDLVAKRTQKEKKLHRETIIKDWQQLGELEAVRNGRVYLVDDDFAFIPGPRFILLVEKLARLFHPEVD